MTGNPKPLQRMNFNGGEIDPSLWYRPDLARYQNGCKVAQNVLINPTGGLKRRPCTQVIKVLPNDVENVRVLPFEFSNDQTFAVVVIERDSTVYVEVYDNDGTQVFQGDSEFPADSLKQIQTVQSYDVLFMAHPDVPLTRLERFADGWRLKEHDFNGGPFERQNTEREKVISLCPMPWINGDDYVVGDHVVVYNVTGGSANNVNGAGAAVLDIPLGDIAHNGFLDVEEVYRSEALDNGGRRDFRRVKFEVTLGSSFPQSGFVFFRGTGSAAIDGHPFKFDQWEISQVTPANATIYCFSGLYIEYDDMDVIVENQFADNGFDFEQGGVGSGDPSTIQVHFVPELSTEHRVYRCVADHDSELVTDLDFWEPVGAYQGDVFLWQEFDPGFWSVPEVGEVFGIRLDEQKGFSGGFGFDGSVNGNTRVDDIDNPNPAFWKEGNKTRWIPGSGKLKVETKGGTWSGDFKVQVSLDGGKTAETVAVTSSRANNNEKLEREIPETGALVRLVMENMLTVDYPDAPTYENPDVCKFAGSITSLRYREFMFVEISALSSVVGKFMIETPLNDSPDSWKWAFRAFNPRMGYPGTVSLFEERLWMSGVPGAPNTLFASSLDDFEEWGEDTFETSPLEFVIASNTFNPIVWIVPRQDLAIGTTSGEHSLGSRSSQDIISGETVSRREHSQYGSAPVQARMMQEVIVYVERDTSTVRGMAFSFDTDGYSSSDLTNFARHVTRPGVTEMAYTKAPENRLMCLREDGEVPVLTFERQQEVMGWSRLQFGDGVVSMAGVSAPKSDRVYMVVRRGSERYLERMDFGSAAKLDHLVEAVESVEGDGVDTLTLAVNTGEAVEVWADGRLLVVGEDYTRASAVITMIGNFPSVMAGFRYEHHIEATDLTIVPTGKGDVAQIDGVDLWHGSAAGGEYRFSRDDQWREIVWHRRDGEELLPLDEANQVRTQINNPGRVSDQLSLAIRGSFPGDFELYAVGVSARRFR